MFILGTYIGILSAIFSAFVCWMCFRWRRRFRVSPFTWCGSLSLAALLWTAMAIFAESGLLSDKSLRRTLDAWKASGNEPADRTIEEFRGRMIARSNSMILSNVGFCFAVSLYAGFVATVAFGKHARLQRQRPIIPEFPKLRLASGLTVEAREIHIGCTYASLLEGVPSDELNRRIVDGLPATIRRIFGEISIYVLPPEIERRTEPHPMGGSRQIAIMPPMQMAMRFVSFQPINPEYDASHLVIVWHQAAASPLIGYSARERLELLDWNALAKDFSY